MTEVVEGQEPNPEEEKTEQIDVGALTARMEKLEQSNTRLLDESKSWKAKYQGVKSEVEQRETEQLAASNDFKGLYEKAMGQVADLKEDLVTTKKKGLKSTLKYEVAKHAKDAIDVDDIIHNINRNPDGIAYDKDKGVWEGIGDSIAELRAKKSHLFDTGKVRMENGRPGNIVPKEKSIDDLINEDPMGVLAEAFKQIL